MEALSHGLTLSSFISANADCLTVTIAFSLGFLLGLFTKIEARKWYIGHGKSTKKL